MLISLLANFLGFMFSSLPWTYNKSLVHQENSIYLSLAKQNTQERSRQGSACFATTAYQLSLTEIFIWPALSPVPPTPHASANLSIPRINSICLTRAGRTLPRVIKHPPLMVHNCHSGYHLPPSTLPIFRPLKVDRGNYTFPSAHLWVVAKVTY